ncbi:MAG: hypothetical protein ACMXYE_05215 [Candidatus Woesearchaeota archaeon]
MKEVDLYASVVNKLQKKYPAYFENLIYDFSEEHNIETEEEFKEMTKQFFYGWLFLDYIMIDGKKLLDFCSQALSLTKDELLMLDKIKNAKRGLFEIKSNSNGILKLKDILTKELYKVSIIDFELKKGIIKANLVYNLENNLFLFGATQKIDKEQAEQYFIEEGLQ